MSTDSYRDSLISFKSSKHVFESASLASPPTTTIKSYDLLSFLETAQSLEIDILPISWDFGRASIGRGGTADISQSFIDTETAFAFKRLASIDSTRFKPKKRLIYEALEAEIRILGHQFFHGHPNINRLEGICWDVDPITEEVWPALVFEKAPHGDLMTFMEHGPGAMLNLGRRLELCADVATAVSDLHHNGRPSTSKLTSLTEGVMMKRKVSFMETSNLRTSWYSMAT